MPNGSLQGSRNRGIVQVHCACTVFHRVARLLVARLRGSMASARNVNVCRLDIRTDEGCERGVVDLHGAARSALGRAESRTQRRQLMPRQRQSEILLQDLGHVLREDCARVLFVACAEHDLQRLVPELSTSRLAQLGVQVAQVSVQAAGTVGRNGLRRRLWRHTNRSHELGIVNLVTAPIVVVLAQKGALLPLSEADPHVFEHVQEARHANHRPGTFSLPAECRVYAVVRPT
mmetsp:Transcript_98194/g.238897  ORF Transcript_98194/g.238897 Transcript_98194/m.238897 type:complete len:232 (-) Transcript_98194:471-1166(-)